MTNANSRPTVVEFLNRKLSKSCKAIEEVATEAGFENVNVVSAILNGSAKLPVSKITSFAHAIDADPGELLRLVLDDYLPGVFEQIETCFEMLLLSKDEENIIEAVRKFAGDDELVALTFNQKQICACLVKVTIG